ncbi:MAG: hypothetical protein ACMXYF_05330 [Candidatus Woesearchaeota archaeon]
MKLTSQLILQALVAIDPKASRLTCQITYSGKFKGCNANVKLLQHPLFPKITFHLSKQFLEVSETIQIGLVQHLYARLKKIQTTTLQMQMYETFTKKLGEFAPLVHNEPELVASFTKMNQLYFQGLLEQPNLKFGQITKRRAGSYEYETDTITISSTLKDRPDLIDFVMYHEMLHKKHKYYTKNNRNYHHHRAFREEERKYPQFEQLDKELARHMHRRKKCTQSNIWHKIFRL